MSSHHGPDFAPSGDPTPGPPPPPAPADPPTQAAAPAAPPTQPDPQRSAGTTAATPSKMKPILLAAGATVLLLIVIATWWAFTRGSAPSVVQGLSDQPEIAWTHDLPKGGGWVPAGDSAALINSGHFGRASAPRVTKLDLTTGNEAWSATLSEQAKSIESGWVYSIFLPKRDEVLAVLQPESGAVSTVVVLDAGSGEVRATTSTSRTRVILPSQQGNIYLVDLSGNTFSRAANPHDLSTTTWTTPIPPLEGGDAVLAVTESDGYALLGWSVDGPVGSSLSSPGFFIAADLATGQAPAWAPRDKVNNHFAKIADVVVESRYSSGTTYVARDLTGAELWKGDDSRGHPVVVDDMLLFSRGDQRMAAMRVNPRTGKDMWAKPTVLPEGVSFLGGLGSALVGFQTTDSLELTLLDPTSGERTAHNRYDISKPRSFFRGEDQLIVANSQVSGAAALTVMALDPARPEAKWRAEFADYDELNRLGSHLVLVDVAKGRLAGLR